MNALETTDEDRANILYMGYLLTKSNRDTPQKTKRIQVKILRSPMSYNNLFQALMFSYHPSYVTDMLRTEVGFELHNLCFAINESFKMTTSYDRGQGSVVG